VPYDTEVSGKTISKIIDEILPDLSRHRKALPPIAEARSPSFAASHRSPRSSDGPYKANLGPHVLYKDGPLWGWMADRNLLPAYAGLPIAPVKFRWEGKIRRTPPFGALPSVLRLRGRKAPVELDFRTWAESQTDERTAAMLSAAAGVLTFHHDPGSLSAAFVWPHTVRALLSGSRCRDGPAVS
jgi:hypothetical protein